MYLKYRSSSEVNDGVESWSEATVRAIDLAINSGLLLAPRRLLLSMAAELKSHTEKPIVIHMDLLKTA